MSKASTVAHKIVPQRISRAIMVGVAVGIAATLILFASSTNETDAGLVIWLMLFFTIPAGGFLWFLLNRAIYSGKSGKWLLVVGLIILICVAFLPNPISLFRR